MRNLVIVIDGVGYDQVELFKPEGLVARGERTGLEPLTTLLAYSSGIYPSIWTGQYPDEHNVWTEFYRRNKPRFAITTPLGLIPGKYLARKIAYVGLAGLERIGIKRPEYYGIPPHIQSKFGRVNASYSKLPPVPMPNFTPISEVFEREGQTWQYVHLVKFDADAVRRIKDASKQVDNLLVCFAELDEMGHHLGPMSDEFGVVFREFDARLSSLIEELEEASPDVSTFLFSDHGMTTVTEQFDAWSYLETRGLGLGRDYLGFINSTLISLWFDDGNKDEVISALNESGYGRVLTRSECIEYHINFPSERYGEEFFLAAEGIELIPNFISLSWRANHGMHGYDPLCSSTRSFFIGCKQVRVQPRDVVGLYDVLKETAKSNVMVEAL